MKKIFQLTVICIAVLYIIACKNSDNNNDSKNIASEENNSKFDTTGTMADAKFAVAIADGGTFEIAAAKLAENNASAPNIKAFAQQMITDHTAAGSELKIMADKKNITLPVNMSTASQKKYNDLTEKKGDAFNKAYVEYMTDDHKDAVDAFQKEAYKGKDNDLRAWASSKLPTIQHHLEMIRSIKTSKE